MPEIDDPWIDELTDSQGRFFGRSAPVQGWPRPLSIDWQRLSLADIEGGGPTDMNFVLHPPWAEPPAPNGYIRPRRHIFDDFLALSSATDEQICNFASKFGPLLIYCRVKSLFDERQLLVQERSMVWRYMAQSMKSLLRIAARLHTGRGQTASDWDAIGTAPPPVSIAVKRMKQMDLLNPSPFLPEEDWSVRTNFIARGFNRDRGMW
jgi:hypothetical protein